MKITDMLVSTLLKHGAFGEMKNFKTEVLMPIPGETEPIKIIITADALQIRMDKGE